MAKASAPRKRLQGVQVPVHVVEALEAIQKIENEAYVVMGGESKKSISDIVSEALNEYVAAWLQENGEIPASPAERREYVKKLAATNLEKLREQLLTKQ
jgi:predicted RNase H-like HicB family nuclease